MQSQIRDYFRTLGELPAKAVVTDRNGAELELEEFFDRALEEINVAELSGNKLMFVGNGGSASVASHMAVDFTKNGGIAALAFNDGVTLTCLGNDLGYDQVFARQIEMYGKPGDLLVAISSSGSSANIVNAVEAARDIGAVAVTMTGFRADNRVRQLGDLNLWVPNGEYGFVEIVHLGFCHAILDMRMGWSLQDGLWSHGQAARGAA